MQNLSLYANDIESLTKGPLAGGTAANAGEVFAPYRSRQKEIGAKYDAGTYGMNPALFTTSQPMGVLNSNNIFALTASGALGAPSLLCMARRCAAGGCWAA